MPSTLVTRRDALHLSILPLLGIAGCTTGSFDETPTTSSTATEQTYEHSVDVPETSTIRHPEGKPAVRSSERFPEEDILESSSLWGHERWIIDTPRERDALEFAEGATGVDRAKDFIADTDLSQETLLVHQYYVDGCTTHTLDQLKWGETSAGDAVGTAIRLNYDTVERDADCQSRDSEDDNPADGSDPTDDTETMFVRIPDTFGVVVSIGYQV